MAIPSNVKRIQKPKPGKYPDEIRIQAINLFKASRDDFKTRRLAAEHVAGLLGIGCTDTVLKWVIQDERDLGLKPGPTTDEIEENRRLRRENAELKRTNGILRAASAFFAAELDRPLAR
jgi:transposase